MCFLLSYCMVVVTIQSAIYYLFINIHHHNIIYYKTVYMSVKRTIFKVAFHFVVEFIERFYNSKYFREAEIYSCLLYTKLAYFNPSRSWGLTYLNYAR